MIIDDDDDDDDDDVNPLDLVPPFLDQWCLLFFLKPIDIH